MTKEFEILHIHYVFDKYTRLLINFPQWKHRKYYKTHNSAMNAIIDLRNSWYNKTYYDYPAMGKKFFHILHQS